MSQLRKTLSNLDSERHKLNSQWQYTSSKWNDYVFIKFKRDFFDIYEPTLNSLLKQLNELDHLIDRALQDVK
jgi:hypothetical protein